MYLINLDQLGQKWALHPELTIQGFSSMLPPSAACTWGLTKALSITVPVYTPGPLIMASVTITSAHTSDSSVASSASITLVYTSSSSAVTLAVFHSANFFA